MDRGRCDEDDGLRGRHLSQGERRQQGEADHHPEGDQGQGNEVAGGGTPLAQDPEQGTAEAGGDHRPRRRQEQRREAADRQTGRGEASR